MAKTEEMRAKMQAEMPLDPDMAAKRLMNVMVMGAKAFDALGVPKDILGQITEQVMAEYLSIYRAKVEDNLLASQKATNDALAAALAMRGAK